MRGKHNVFVMEDVMYQKKQHRAYQQQRRNWLAAQTRLHRLLRVTPLQLWKKTVSQPDIVLLFFVLVVYMFEFCFVMFFSLFSQVLYLLLYAGT